MSSDPVWTIATAEDDGKPLIFRIRSQPPAFGQKADFPCLLAISWKYEPLNETGMPSLDLAEEMTQLEHLLVDALEGAEHAFLTVVVTGNGVREWQWYSRDPEETMRLVNEALADCEPFPVQFVIDEDPDWTAYSRFQVLLGE